MEMILYYGAFAIVILASLIIRIVYFIYKKEAIESNIDGNIAAKMILESNGINNVKITEISGELTDYYSDGRKEIALSSDIYSSSSIAAVAVAAHECGHAIQYKEGYFPIKLRNIIFPFVNVGTIAGYIMLLISGFFSIIKFYKLGIIFVSVGIIFQLVTLPVEFNASKRAKNALRDLNIIDDSEKFGVAIMLFAAGFTYIAALISSLLDILRLILPLISDDD